MNPQRKVVFARIKMKRPIHKICENFSTQKSSLIQSAWSKTDLVFLVYCLGRGHTVKSQCLELSSRCVWPRLQ